MRKPLLTAAFVFLTMLPKCSAVPASEKSAPRPQSVSSEPAPQQQAPSQTSPDGRVHVELEAIIVIDFGVVKVIVRAKTDQGEIVIRKAYTWAADTAGDATRWTRDRAGDAARWTGDKAKKVADRVTGWFR
jgi:hypothetical protein